MADKELGWVENILLVLDSVSLSVENDCCIFLIETLVLLQLLVN